MARVGTGNTAHARAKLRTAQHRLCAAHPDAGGAVLHPVGAQDWLGLCLAHADRGGTGVWRLVRQGGLGWYIFQNRNELYTDKVFAGLILVVLLGLLVESLGFHTLERMTVRRCGVQR